MGETQQKNFMLSREACSILKYAAGKVPTSETKIVELLIAMRGMQIPEMFEPGKRLIYGTICSAVTNEKPEISARFERALIASKQSSPRPSSGRPVSSRSHLAGTGKGRVVSALVASPARPPNHKKK